MEKFHISLDQNFPGRPVYLGLGIYAHEIGNSAAERFAVTAQQNNEFTTVGFMDQKDLSGRIFNLSNGDGNPSARFERKFCSDARKQVTNRSVQPSFLIDRDQLAIFRLNKVYNHSEMISANFPGSNYQVAVCEVRGMHAMEPIMVPASYDGLSGVMAVPEPMTPRRNAWMIARVDGVYRAYPLQPDMRPT